MPRLPKLVGDIPKAGGLTDYTGGRTAFYICFPKTGRRGYKAGAKKTSIGVGEEKPAARRWFGLNWKKRQNERSRRI